MGKAILILVMAIYAEIYVIYRFLEKSETDPDVKGVQFEEKINDTFTERKRPVKARKDITYLSCYQELINKFNINMGSSYELF